jgi:hypothetical protein
MVRLATAPWPALMPSSPTSLGREHITTSTSNRGDSKRRAIMLPDRHSIGSTEPPIRERRHPQRLGTGYRAIACWTIGITRPALAAASRVAYALLIEASDRIPTDSIRTSKDAIAEREASLSRTHTAKGPPMMQPGSVSISRTSAPSNHRQRCPKTRSRTEFFNGIDPLLPFGLVKSSHTLSRLRSEASYRSGSDRGSSNQGSTLFSKRVRAQIRSPARVGTNGPVPWRMPVEVRR